MNASTFQHPSAQPLKPGQMPKPALKQKSEPVTSGEGINETTTTTTKTKTSYSDRLRDQSAQFVVYLLSLIAALSVSNIVQDGMKSLATWKRVMIAVGIVLFSLAMVTAVAAWMDDD